MTREQELTHNTPDGEMRVRFAPSPTGHLHVGGARTALYNWLLARGTGGSFVLRIEDTDLERSTETAVKQIIDSMRWLGLDWDEGPDAGGGHGPYRQTERLEIYGQAAARLLEAGHAYRCYCTPAELQERKERLRREGKPSLYDGRCRGLSDDERQRQEESGKASVIRLRTPDQGATVINDLIRGEISFENSSIGDFILVRSNGVPTYNFAVAVDDAAMKISHIVRGDDHIPNTPRQLMVLKALGEPAPAYAHLPLILGADKTPLSKRHGSVSVEEFRRQGYLPEALVNYLALLGWSYDDRTNIFSRAELVEKFSLERVGSAAAVFDTEKLLWLNGQYIRGLDDAELARRLDEYVKDTPLAGLPGSGGRPSLASLAPHVKEKMKTLADFIDLADFFFIAPAYGPEALDKLREDDESLARLAALRDQLAALPEFSITAVEEALRAAAAAADVKLGRYLQPLRIAVSGRTITPGMFETLALLGKEETISRIDAALGQAGG